MSIEKWILTIPHGECGGTDPIAYRHPCDYTARKAADALARALRKYEAASTAIVAIDPDTIRADGDLNRAATSEAPFHALWKREVRSVKRSCLIDVHSFDVRTFFVGTTTLLEAAPHVQPWSREFVERTEGVVAYERGSSIYYIVNTCTQMLGRPALLIEFWEGITDIQHTVDVIARVLVAMSRQGRIKN